MNLLSFDELRKLPVISFYEESFRKATGVPLKVVAPGAPKHRLGLGLAENEFCRMVAGTPAGCEACHAAQGRALAGAANRNAPHQIACFAGLTDVAVPVTVAGVLIASMLCGQVLRREPTERDFTMIAEMVEKDKDERWRKAARDAYFATPVVTADRLQAIVQLLGLFASFLGEYASRQVIARSPAEPAAVTRAKDYVERHLAGPITLGQLVQHVGVSRFYLCKLFKKSTGMTLTEHVARMRLEKAKALLVDPANRITEVAFRAGFGSIPQFNSVFKRYVGVAPTEYRESLQRDLPPSSLLTG
jgi:AraC-like DNA-binding protein/ligand-binding sensor protein